MPNSSLLNFSDKQSEVFKTNLDKVLLELEKRLLNLVGEATLTGTDNYDAALFLNGRPAMLQALRDAGFYTLAEEHVATYEDLPDVVKKVFAGRNLPAPKFTSADATLFQSLARADLDTFAVIGEKALDDLRLGLYRSALTRQPFAQLVEQVRASTVGVAKNNSPLANYAYTHANTALLRFSGEVVITAGESIGADKWEVVGPLDNVTREECRDALADPVRTREEWEVADYFGGTPGGYNCRHQHMPFFG